MRMTYWIAERKDSKAFLTLRAGTREELYEFIKVNKLRTHYDIYYDLPREVTVEAGEILSVVKACIDRESHQILPWEKK